MKSFKFKLPNDKLTDVYKNVLDLLDGLPDGMYEISAGKQKRTSLQNACIHKFCTWVADGLNHIGQYQKKMSVMNDEVVIENKWTLDLVKNDIWRPVQIQLTGKKSTTQLTTKEVSDVSEPLINALNEKFGHLGLLLRWPNKDDVEKDKYYNLK